MRDAVDQIADIADDVFLRRSVAGARAVDVADTAAAGRVLDKVVRVNCGFKRVIEV